MVLAIEPGELSTRELLPTNLDLVVDLLTSADEAQSVGDVVARAAARLADVLGSSSALGLVLSPLVSPVGDPHACSPHGALVDVLRRVQPWIADAVWVDRGSSRHVDPDVAVAAAETIAIHDQWLWALHRLNDHTVALVLDASAMPRARVVATQNALGTLLGAMLDRYQKAVRQRRRLERVAALCQVLEEVASHLDVDQTLATIVARARDLLAADSAFLAEFDEVRQSVRTRVSLGLRDDALRHGVVAVGQGLSGAVALSRRVMWTHDYIADPGFAHTRDTDAPIRREGLRSMLVAPLQAGNRLLGVLGVMHHRVVDFGDDDLNLIKHLADGAAIALENARLYAGQAGLVSRLRSLNEQAMQQNDALRRSQQIHDQLSALVLQGRGIDDIARRLSSLIGNPVVVLGPHFNRVAASVSKDASDITDRLAAFRTSSTIGAELARVASERRPVHLAPDAALDLPHSLLVAPILTGRDLLGYVLVVEAERGFTALDFQALEQAATVFALELTRERFVDEVERRLRGDFIHDLIAAGFDRRTVVERAARLGHDLTLPQLLLAVALDERSGAPDGQDDGGVGAVPAPLDWALRTSLRRRSPMAQTSVAGDVMIALVALPRNGADAAAVRTLLRQIRTDLAAYLAPRTASIGVGRVRYSPDELQVAHQEAVQALRGSQRLGVAGQVAEYDRLGVERLLTQLLENQALTRFVDDVLGPLAAYDETHGTDLLATLDAYLRLGCRQRATADALGIHVNSLHYRLQRIQEVGDLDLENADVRLNLQLALRSRLVLQATDDRS
ncbi:MAG TPA: GAF domain-containing protein [Thermomicrobiales bacterium]